MVDANIRAMGLLQPRLVNLNAIVHDVITKPFSVSDIRAAVAAALAAGKS